MFCNSSVAFFRCVCYCIFVAKRTCYIYVVCVRVNTRMTNSLPETISVTLISFESGTMGSSCWPFSVSLPRANLFNASVET